MILTWNSWRAASSYIDPLGGIVFTALSTAAAVVGSSIVGRIDLTGEKSHVEIVGIKSAKGLTGAV